MGTLVVGTTHCIFARNDWVVCACGGWCFACMCLCMFVCGAVRVWGCTCVWLYVCVAVWPGSAVIRTRSRPTVSVESTQTHATTPWSLEQLAHCASSMVAAAQGSEYMVSHSYTVVVCVQHHRKMRLPDVGLRLLRVGVGGWHCVVVRCSADVCPHALATAARPKCVSRNQIGLAPVPSSARVLRPIHAKLASLRSVAGTVLLSATPRLLVYMPVCGCGCG